ncbi:cuticle protein 67-like [Diorhabda carinulata]|uniref:cuticle protein 67-like n=1 Tax=Diorhabda carinulata TaxID=1163345 RepID=UPI0025A2B012|nr:cuticle protein 67-like [Diorhabda carinulata]
MVFKLIVLCSLLAYATAGVIEAPLAPGALAYSAPAAFAYSPPALAAAPIQYTAPALTSQSSNIYRSFGNLGQISTYSKSIDTPFSSVRKADVRVSNPGLRIATAEHIAQPLLGVAYSAAPAVSHVNFVTGYTHYDF